MVSRLRRALTVVAPNVDPTRVVVTLPAGYILDIQPSNADTLAFERLTADGRRALSVGEPELALARRGCRPRAVARQRVRGLR